MAKWTDNLKFWRSPDWTEFKRFLIYFKPYAFWVGVAFVCALLVAATTAATAYLVQPAMDKVFTEADKEVAMFWLKLIPVAVVLIYILKGLFRFAQNYILLVVGQRVIRLLRNQLYDHFQDLSIDYYSDTNTGVMMSRITNDVNMMERAVPSITNLFREPITLISLAVLAFYQWWQLALIILVLFPATAYPIVRFGKKIRKYTKRGQERMGELTGILKENFTGIRVIKAFGMEDYERERFQVENQKVYDANVKRSKWDELSSPVIEVLGALAAAVVILYGGSLVIQGDLTTGKFFSFMASLGLMYEPLKRVNKMYSAFQSALAAATRVFEVFDTPASVHDCPAAVELPALRDTVTFENVHFAYNDADGEVLKGIAFQSHVGQMIAFVGSSGSGKTTLINLIPRFYDPTGGRVLIDDCDISTATIRSLRSQIAMVTQDTFLFADSIRNNIAYGQAGAPMEKIVEAAKRANAHEFIEHTPKKYDTQIGELGVKLSGGQRQRLAIARALFKNAPILILDEATSSLDTEAEAEVQEALENLMAGRTTFVIAHRLSTIRRADRILVLRDGVIVEDGRHEDLIAHDGEYARLYKMQFRDE